MGEVYRATDSRLGRDVALKILPPPLAANADRMARFDREARLLASLNHPAIAAIYGIDEHEGRRFLVMELAEGEDLAQRLERGPLSLAEAVDVARQIAGALEMAHARGIVHRDLKPANIKRSGRGKVKVLDFGLAKALADEAPSSGTLEDAPTAAFPLTRSGTILGTAPYMSPEQARGENTDTRTDIWAFGCVLWECLTGERLFGGRTPSDSIGAVLRVEPEWNRLPAGTPPGVRRLLRRCLTKDPERRLQHIADARIELEDPDTLATASPPPAAVATRSARRYRVAAFALGALVVVVVGLWVWDQARSIRGAGSGEKVSNPLASARFTRLTDFPGDEFDAAVSPDGRFVAFVSDRDGPFDVLVGQIDLGEFRNVTQSWDERGRREARTPLRSVGFTGAGTELWLGGGTGFRLKTLPLLGGPPRNFLADDVVNVDWSPDGSRIAFHRSSAGDPLFVAGRDGADEKLILPSEPGHHQHYPRWSPDDRWIYLVRGRPITGETDLWRIRPDGDGLERLTEGLLDVTYPTPIGVRTVLFCARETNGAGPWLWSVDPETRLRRRVALGVEQYSSVSASADGLRLVATVENPQASLWRVPVLDRVATERDAQRLDLKTVRALTPRFGKDRLFYLSSRGAGDGLWSRRDGESVEIWKGRDTALLVPPAISSDGGSVALVLRRGSAQRLHVLSADGAQVRALTDRVDVRRTVSWSPDGSRIVAGGIEDEVEGLFLVPVDGGAPKRIVEGEALSPVWSPTGNLIVYAGAQVQALSVLRAVRPDGEPVELPDIRVLREGGGERFRFLPDGSGLVYMQGLSPSQDFWLLDLATMKSRRLTRLEDPATMQTFDVSPDGTEIVFDRLRHDSDLVLIELEGMPRESSTDGD